MNHHIYQPQFGQRSYPTMMFIRIAAVMVAIFCVLMNICTNWHLYWIYIASISIVTFIAYGSDKCLAIMNGLRVPETGLHLLALFGGFPGGWMGRFIFRHKIRKPVFFLVLTISTLMHIVLGYYLFVY